MMELIKMLPYMAVALISAYGVFTKYFDDNLLQRIGLSLICTGSTLFVVIADLKHNTDSSCLIMTYGVAVYAVGTVVKLFKARKNDG